MLVLAVENHPEKQANCGDGDLYVLLFTVVYLQIYSIVFRKCHLSDIGQAIGQVPVLTRMKPALIIEAMQRAGKETPCAPQAN